MRGMFRLKAEGGMGPPPQTVKKLDYEAGVEVCQPACLKACVRACRALKKLLQQQSWRCSFCTSCGQAHGQAVLAGARLLRAALLDSSTRPSAGILALCCSYCTDGRCMR